MGRPDIPAAKRAGLPVDLARLVAEGDGWLTDDERYALKAHGVCAQGQSGVFMVRIRTSGGILDAATLRGVAALADAYGGGWVHTTTRQQLELHHVAAHDVVSVLTAVIDLGLTTSSTCGHTMRGVMSCPDAGVGLDEPFDCYPDARAISDSVLERTPALNCQLPQRINIALGGCGRCREHARTNDIGLVSTVRDGQPGYGLWLGGSLGKSLPTLAFRAADFLPRSHVLPAVHAVIDVFVEHGEFDRPARARLKHLVVDSGVETFLDLYQGALARTLRQRWPEPVPVTVLAPALSEPVLACAPPGGWRPGVRPQRQPGVAIVTVRVPLGDLDSDDLRGLADLAEEVGDGRLYLTRNQNVSLRGVPVADVPTVEARLAVLRLTVDGADTATDVRACTGGPVCSLALTPSTAVAARLLDHPALRRNSALRVHVSGCMNACAQHQVADIGLSGSKVTIDGYPMLGYQVWLGGGPDRVGAVVGRVAEGDVVVIVGAIVGVWETLRDRGETLSATADRVGLKAFGAHIDAVFAGRWETGDEPSLERPARDVDHTLPLVGV